MTTAQQRMLDILARQSAREVQRHADSSGYVAAWDVCEAWGQSMPLGFVPYAAWKCMAALKRAGLVDSHPEHEELVRPCA